MSERNKEIMVKYLDNLGEGYKGICTKFSNFL